MPYPAFEDNAPVTSDQGNTVVDDTRKNLMAIRDQLAFLMAMPGWNAARDGGTTLKPAAYNIDKASPSTERVRIEITWGTTGGAKDNPTVMVEKYTADRSGTPTYETIGTLTFAWNSDGTFNTSTWS